MKKSQKLNRGAFINCPFDRQYLPLLHAQVFAIHDAGFIARCALEVVETGEARLAKICRIIDACCYGIHDLSRVETGKSGLPRLNMAFELGLFFGYKTSGNARQRHKKILVLDSKRYRYLRTISDLAGRDAECHSDSVKELITIVRNWLKTTSGLKNIPGGAAILRRYRQFQADLPGMLKLAKVSKREIQKLAFFSDYREFVIAWLETNPS
ncbi:MAG: hypothetical protein U0984_09580 [Prosthecobacter sp.]|nr:hypothetical protein [Prosthecobacter sp.]